MRKPMMIRLGVAAVAITAVTGITACGATQSPASGSTPAGAATTTGTTSPTTSAGTTISQAEAERIAVAAVAGSRVTETRLDTDRGSAVWNVHLSKPTGNVEIKVDARTGAIRDDGNGTRTTTGGSDDGAAHG